MKDISLLVNKYRETVRHLWNTSFFVGDELSDYSQDTLDYFQRIDQLLFSSLVLEKIGLQAFEKEYDREILSKPLEFIHVVPSAEDGVQILINRSGPPATGYWDDPINRVKPLEVDLRFLGYFDWNPYGHLNLQYYRVRIMACLPHPHLVGRDALLETSNARVLFDDKQGT